ncbi:tRNA (cytidine/uridine-2'-O-)-methyltransferase [Arsukibacterium tuosuense]|uniref:tRNA (cytidine(34)-2'-O)-methyltransferase n=1 Tax=Arsukibacterium tuosuense TaxID=1323745 RepID=A0A285JE36_9GAMM|nr:tRNA (cytidine(34)-2'-O)-methyltransferase [Arsukibacterium tuosuense]SNY57421.1 tRNA (cytidine/uridine-2'-O-)-methyltransferase [Arsukibacterium tuosuense]
MFHIALFEPRIAPNTGNIIRLAANTGCRLHIIEPMGFDFEEKKLRRAGLDYHDLANVSRYTDYQTFAAAMAGKRILALTTKGSQPYQQQQFRADDILLFGSETSGLPDSVRDTIPAGQRIRVPMQPGARSLNLANTVAIVCYEAWRQHDFAGGI